MLRDDKPVALTPKAVETLAVLIENRNEVVSKEVLSNRVWPGTFVGDGSLMRNISDLRRALSEWDAACIDTIPRRGYRFNAGVTEVNHGQSSGRRSIAVLPFQFPQGNARDRAVAASIVEAIITKLSSVRECDVRPSGVHAQAEFVLQGSIRRHRDKARVSVRLLPSNGDPPLWSETIEETYADAFEFEDSISDELAG